MAKMIAYCGTDCTECEGYQATQADDDAQRAEVAKQWSARFSADIKPEHINCDGCKGDGRQLVFCSDMCEIRKCCLEKDIDNCAACDECPCEKLEAFFQIAPELRTAMDALR